MKELLFICTGNFYRSRFAEGLFNHLCAEHPIGWHAFSRGLAIHMVLDNCELSPYTATAFQRMGIDPCHSGERRIPLTEEDLQRADRIIALKYDEHYPMMLKKFPAWAEKTEYWAVHDIDFIDPQTALPQIETKVRALYAKLAAMPNGQDA